MHKETIWKQQEQRYLPKNTIERMVYVLFYIIVWIILRTKSCIFSWYRLHNNPHGCCKVFLTIHQVTDGKIVICLILSPVLNQSRVMHLLPKPKNIGLLLKQNSCASPLLRNPGQSSSVEHRASVVGQKLQQTDCTKIFLQQKNISSPCSCCSSCCSCSHGSLNMGFSKTWSL